jgi:uracil-DNA glycosylase
MKHGIIKSAHPSPLSFNKFLNSKCFSKANDFLIKNGKTPIKWNLSE